MTKSFTLEEVFCWAQEHGWVLLRQDTIRAFAEAAHVEVELKDGGVRVIWTDVETKENSR